MRYAGNVVRTSGSSVIGVNNGGRSEMNKSEILELLMLLSALESWSFADKHKLPDYLLDRIDSSIGMLAKELLGEGETK